MWRVADLRQGGTRAGRSGQVGSTGRRPSDSGGPADGLVARCNLRGPGSRWVVGQFDAVSLHYMHCNFARRHQTLTTQYRRSTTLAMAAGKADQVWSVCKIARLLD